MSIRTFQFGTGMAEFITVAIPVILLGLSGIELASWLNMRQIISVALVNAGRAASSQNAQPQVIADVFKNSLHMAYPDSKSLERRLKQNQADLNLPWQIKILNPSTKSFSDHQSNSAYVANKPYGQPVINNYYQDLQHQNNIQRGWPLGRGPVSNKDIFQANTLDLELIWPQQPLLPGIKQIIILLKPFFNTNQDIAAAGYLPFVRNISLSMQSHPVLWPNLDDGRVIYADQNDLVQTTNTFGSTKCQPENNIDINCKYIPPAINTSTNSKPQTKPVGNHLNNDASAGQGSNTTYSQNDKHANDSWNTAPENDTAGCAVAY